MFRYAAVDADAAPVCLKVYADSSCKNAPREFDHVIASDGTVVCVVNYHNPPISAACAASPDLYEWVDAAYP